LSCECTGRVRNTTGARLRNPTADGVRHLLVADFRNHSSALNLLLDDFWAPDTATDGAIRTLNFCRAGTAWTAEIRNTGSCTDCTRNLSSHGLPLTGTNVNTTCFRNRLVYCVADIFPAGLGFCLPGRVALVAIAGLVAGLANFVAHGAITGFITGLANVVTDVAITRLVTGLPNIICHCAITGFRHWLADCLLHTAILSLIYRLTHRVAFVTIACFIHVANALNRYGLRTLIIDRLHAGVLLLFHDNVSHCAILRNTSAFCSGEVTALVAGFDRTDRKTSSSAQPGHYQTAVKQYGNCSSGSNHEPCHCLIPHCLVSNRIGGSLARTSSST